MIDKSSIFVLSLVNIVILSWATDQNSTQHCNRVCGGIPVNYPFGFSTTCEFPLNCSPDGLMQFMGFGIRFISSNDLLLNISSNCTRPVHHLQQLFGKNYGLTSENELLLLNCSSPVNRCVVPSGLLETRLQPDGRCVNWPGPGETMNCYTSDGGVEGGILRYRDVSNTGCKYLLSSVVVDTHSSNLNSNSSSENNSDVSLDFKAIQVGWWLNGKCRCDVNANCTTVGATGYRCRCREGFSGDGFSDGDGCRVSGDHASAFKHYEDNKIAVLIGGIIAGAVSVIVLAAMCYCCRRHSKFLSRGMDARHRLCEAVGESIVPFYPYKEIERATSGFSEKQRLGTGAYGTVYAGRLHNNECVAIKKLRNRDNDGAEQVMNEIKLLSSVSHPNLVRLLGCCIENGEQILVYEYMANGTLSEHLQRERGNGLPWTVRLTIATETAQAIAFLHSAMNPPIYHRDIKSSNILLDYEYRSKVADFGLSRLGLMETSHISTAPQGTPGYVDPQYHQNFHLSDKSDVYSFGVVLVEIITAMRVVDFSRHQADVNLAALAIDRIGKGQVDEIIDPFIELHRDAWTLSSVHKVAELAFRCLAYHRDMRPSMMEVAHELELTRQTGWASMEENICMGSSVASSCSSPFNGSERSLSCLSAKKFIGNRNGIVQKTGDPLASLEEGKDGSPVSVHDPWFSDQSSPSANSLLGNVVR